MATVSKTRPSKETKPPRRRPDPDQLRRDRIVAIAMFILIALFMALVVWLASLGGGTVESPDYYFPLMP